MEDYNAVKNLLMLCLPPHLLGIVFSLMVIFYDNICCCCCGCCLGAEERMVYDPDHPEAELLWRDGQVLSENLKHLVSCINISRLLNWRRIRMGWRKRLRFND